MYRKYIKRLLDILCAIAALAVFWWLYVIIAILVRIKLGSPILFRQERPGKDEKIFKLYKFRTMTDERDEKGELLPDDVRLTKFGKWLRTTSLDELPEAFNILKGNMSVVGPRPLLVRYLARYNADQHRRHEVRPGLSGWAQVNGRNTVSWEDRFEYDIWYVDHVSFLLDVKIIFMTVMKAFVKREGISSETSATMEEFNGEKTTRLQSPNDKYSNKTKKLIIVGAGGHGKVIADIASKDDYQGIYFLDDDQQNRTCLDYPVVGNASDYKEYKDYDFVVAIGNPYVREEIQNKLLSENFNVVTLKHPDSVVASDVRIGIGSVIMAGAVVNSGSSIGNGCIINTGATVDHDNQISDYVHVSVGSHLAGTVEVEKYTWIGAGAIVTNNVKIASDSMIGAGTVVISNIERAGTYVGVPAHFIGENKMKKQYVMKKSGGGIPQE